MSEEAGQRTEAASDRKLEQAKERGEVPVAAETRNAGLLAGAWLAGAALAADAAGGLLALVGDMLGEAGTLRLGPGTADDTGATLIAVAGLLAPALGLLFAAALVAGLAQGPFAIAAARLKPKWASLNPAAGLKRLFGPAGLANFGKTLAKLGIAIAAAWWALTPPVPVLDRAAAGLDAGELLTATGAAALRLLAAAAVLAAMLAVADQLWTRLAFARRMRMTRQETRDEHKDSDGDPLVKAKRRAAQRGRRARMMSAVPDATVVIVNPTHYAVALQYEHGVSAAPRAVAKGIDDLALRIRAVAEAAGVPVVEDPVAARTLHAVCEVDREIPPETYVAVATIIRYVMSRRTGL